MSGIVGVCNLDGAPVDRGLLLRMTNSLTFRGPDAQKINVNGPIGFGHTLLKTTEEAEHERQPFTLDGQVWIVADARIDARCELITSLAARGQIATLSVPDVELILRAYLAWGEACVENLLGDFAFGIWDAARRRLFCARDHMGVKPFYYAHVGERVVFSNTLDCVRMHPAVSNRLNDLAIADFLLFEYNHDVATTSFADIQRLAPAHCLTWSPELTNLRRYWRMPIDEPLLYPRAGDYIDRFNELLREATGDRIRTSRIGVFMSGGLDSTTMAVAAQDVLSQRYSNYDLRAFTRVDALYPDEGYYAGLVAERLGIPIDYKKTRDFVNENWEQTASRMAEPACNAMDLPLYQAYTRELVERGRVFFMGEGPDNALCYEWRPYLAHLYRRRLFRPFVSGFASHVGSRRTMPYWNRVSYWFATRRGTPQYSPPYPDWIDEGFAARLELKKRWEQGPTIDVPLHPVRPRSYSAIDTPAIPNTCEWHDAGNTLTPLQLRHPLLDIRLLRYMLAVPAIPWCRSKHLLRAANRDKLPRSVCVRPKSGVSCESVVQRLRGSGFAPFKPVLDLSRYIDVDRLPATASQDMWIFGNELRARMLNHWLRYSLNSLHSDSGMNGGLHDDLIGERLS
jgi:asparagine synthase (glutamine-hydrolysing)